LLNLLNGKFTKDNTGNMLYENCKSKRMVAKKQVIKLMNLSDKWILTNEIF